MEKQTLEALLISYEARICKGNDNDIIDLGIIYRHFSPDIEI
jgi:hypothetical protein